MHKLHAVYVAMLNNMWDIEDQLCANIPKMLSHAHHAELKKSLTDHLEETREQKLRLEELLTFLGQSRTYERDMAFLTLLQDNLSDLTFIEEQNVKDAFIIAVCQTIEYIEISRYHTLTLWARALSDEQGVQILQKNLYEEERQNKKLDDIAKSGLLNIGINEKD